ncbi:ATP-binding cassette domain-containing protein [Mesorhizobium sp. M0924]|uniref:ABC transporter ATP-binding protein n=1 Tax=unclassified Mesorhizobium TaxID=325217 RepID=UPI00333D1E35
MARITCTTEDVSSARPDFDKSSCDDEAALRVEGLEKSFGNYPVLRGVTLTAHRHEVICILGSSGSGKSTLLRCLNLLEVPNRGRMWALGERLKLREAVNGRGGAILDRRQVQRVRASLGMVFQSFNLWPHRTILENVAEGPTHVLRQPRREAIGVAEHYLARVGLADRRHHHPRHLSGGQQQRAGIARALAMEPAVLLFDEPTSALDPELTGEVLKVIRSLAEEGRTMLLVTHELAFAREVSTRAAFMHDGKIEEEGPSRELFLEPASERLRQFLQSHY